MGGINCPPGNFDPASSRVMDEYVHKLADYCEPLFDGVASFYAVNADIERMVKGKLDLAEVIGALEASADCLRVSSQRLDIVAPMWELVSNEPVDFRIQSAKLHHAIEAISEARAALQSLPSDSGINTQYEIWKRYDITASLTDASSAISDALAWQTRFAKHSAILVAAAA